MTVPEAPVDLEVVAIGRVGVDLYAEQVGLSLAEVRSFAKSLGGSPTNVAVAAARLGRRTAIVTKVGADGFGMYVRDALGRFGVWPGWVGTEPELRTSVVFAEIHPPDHFPMLFYRDPRAPDTLLTSEDFSAEVVDQVPLVWVSGQSLAQEPSRTTVLDVMVRRRGRCHTVLDLDHRPGLWPSATEERMWLARAASEASVVVGNAAEAELVVGTSHPEDAGKRLLELGAELALVKLGPKGSYAVRRGAEPVAVGAPSVETLCGLGAGDAFGGALVHGLLAGWELRKVLEIANAAGALVASRLACADAMPVLDEIMDLVRR